MIGNAWIVLTFRTFQNINVIEIDLIVSHILLY